MWLPVLPESVSLARHRARRFVRLPPQADSVLGLLITEMVGSVVRTLPNSADRAIEVRLATRPDGVRATVTAPGFALRAVDGTDAGALGHVILERLADDFGTTADGFWVQLRARGARG